MRRNGKHKVKEERPETSVSTDTQERDLTYYIHDRVELMHQVFSVLKAKELNEMAPYCVQHISLNDLQELCTEELLGISSKRLCAILDGAEPPSDTETSSNSSPERLETISLDSISSDEEILSERGKNKKKKHKHCRHGTKAKHKQKSSSEGSETNMDKSQASRAGLTVLELLELQARARAIRAQLQQEQAVDAVESTAPSTVQPVSDDEVEIKEEPTAVVEISSDEEKPNIEDLNTEKSQAPKTSAEEQNKDAQAVVKRISDLIITVPQAKFTRKIKLNRSKAPISDVNYGNKPKSTQPVTSQVADIERKEEPTCDNNEIYKNQNELTITIQNKPAAKEKQKKKPKRKGKTKKKEGSDHDEITLQLSDSEKIDLLEDLDRKNYDNVSSSSTEDSASSSDTSENEEKSYKKKSSKSVLNIEETFKSQALEGNKHHDKETGKEKTLCIESEGAGNHEQCEMNTIQIIEIDNIVDKISENQSEDLPMATTTSTSICNDSILQDVTENLEKSSIFEKSNKQEDTLESSEASRNAVRDVEDNGDIGGVEDVASIKESVVKDRSEGEITDCESSEVEASEVRPEVVCISDEEVSNKKGHKKKKNKKKTKVGKKSKKTQDFYKPADQNFYSEPDSKDKSIAIDETAVESGTCVDDDVYEILELSDESSCNEEDGRSVLSKEPTAEEIEALSAKIDEIEREDVITEEEIMEHERTKASKEGEAENISWKDRYLDSKKVKRVLTSSNIFNAMRKKNKELKRKLEESKREIVTTVPVVPEKTETNLEEGSVQHYNTLEGSTKYVDPVQEIEDTKTKMDDKITREMKKDAKQLLKMYKKLLKYNDMNRQKSPNKKKKKKQKKSKEEKNKMAASTETKINS